jgi:TRAP-type transport system small permease protein
MACSDFLAEHYEEKGPVMWLAFFLECVAALVLLGLMLFTCVDVIGRYFFNNALDGSVEITELALAILVFAEMPVITWRGGHVVVDLFDRYLGPLAVKVLGILSALIVTTAFYGLADRLIFAAARSLQRGVVTEYLQIPVGYIVQYVAAMSYTCALLMITWGIWRIVTERQS